MPTYTIHRACGHRTTHQANPQAGAQTQANDAAEQIIRDVDHPGAECPRCQGSTSIWQQLTNLFGV